MNPIPLYEYRCDPCKEDFERIKKFSESSDDVSCPKCGKLSKRKFSAPLCIVEGGTGAGRGTHMLTLGDFNDKNDWIYS